MKVKRKLAAMLAVLTLAVDASPVWASAAAASSTTTALSSNWAGYAVTGTTYSSVSGSWVQPTATCDSTSSTSGSAFWVGLGGDSTTSDALEQVGTEADCTAAGTAVYHAWYELVPAPSVKIPLRISAGDTLEASVSVNAKNVTFEITDSTTGKSFTKTLTATGTDVSSAEWIAEAPSIVTQDGRAAVVSLTNFGTVKFTDATATTTSGLTHSISYSGWSLQRIRLVTASSVGPGQFAAAQREVEATPTSLRANGGAFAVSWKQVAGLPAAGGGFPPGF